MGISNSHGGDNKPNIIKYIYGAKFVYANSTITESLVLENRFHIVASTVVHLIFMPYLCQLDPLFDTRNKAIVFAMLQHPVDSSMYMLHSLQTSNAYKYSNVRINKVGNYNKTNPVLNNWMRLFISKKMPGENTMDKKSTYRDILRTKILVTFLEHKK